MASKTTVSVCLRMGAFPERWLDIEYESALEFNTKLQRGAEAYVADVGVRAPYGTDQFAEVSQRRYKLQQGKVVPDGPERKLSIRVMQDRMTEEQFNKIQDELLAQITRAFHGWASCFAYDRGHSAGHEEVITELRNLVSGITETIEAYRKELTEGVPA